MSSSKDYLKKIKKSKFFTEEVKEELNNRIASELEKSNKLKKDQLIDKFNKIGDKEVLQLFKPHLLY